MTIEPKWLQLRTVIAIHDAQIREYGGLSGIRDQGALESAIARPQQLYHYSQPSLVELAAAYAYGITRNHPFSDANKRSAFVVAATFLAINGCRLKVGEAMVVEVMYKLAAGEMTEGAFSEWLGKYCLVLEKVKSDS